MRNIEPPAKWPTGSGKGFNPRVFCANQRLLNKFFDPNTRFMRKGRDGGEKSEMKKNERK